MGVAIAGAGFHEDAASGAQVIDGGLRFDSSKKQYLTRTFSTPTNNIKWTWSGWIKRTNLATDYRTLFNGANAANNYSSIEFDNADIIRAYLRPSSAGGVTAIRSTSAVYRDISGWYHISVIWDSANATAADRLQVYVNGTRILNFSSSTDPTSSEASVINSAIGHGIGRQYQYDGYYFDGFMSQIYFIDGQALDPSYFGYTDPLTNTWRPKKLSSSIAFGTNGFYLPFDGNSPIGQDMSGKGNNWTPVNFGGSNTIEKATGALPILNTDGGGKVARVGVRTDSNASSLVLALPLVGIKSDFSNAINSGTSNKSVTVTGATASTAQSIFYGSSYNFTSSSTGASQQYLDVSPFITATSNWTLEFWFYRTQYTNNFAYIFNDDTSGALNCGENTTGGISVGRDWTTASTTYTPATPLNTWTHFAISVSGGVATQYLNGVAVTTDSNMGITRTPSVDMRIGGEPRRDYGGNGRQFYGYLQDIRFYNGVAKYTQNFIPASTDPDILPDTPSGVAYSSNVVLAPTNEGAVSLSSDGSGDYLSLSASADFGFSTPSGNSNDFTIEWFKYWTSLSGYQTIWSNNYISSPGLLIQTGNGDGKYRVFVSSGTEIFQETNAATTGKWYHYALVRNGTTYTLYRDGIANGSATSSSAAGSGSDAATIGQGNGGFYENGFISNFHLVKGTALYTSNFIPPTGPINSVANTKLLCCKSRTSATVFDVSPGTITANGDAGATNINPFTVNINTQRGQESGYCTLNPLDLADFTLSNGNLNYSKTSTTWKSVRATQGVNSGKWYYEFQFGSDNRHYIGISQSSMAIANYPGATSTSYSIYLYNGYKSNNGSDSAYASAFASTDVLGVAFDLDASTITFYKNGVSLGVAFTSIASGYYFPTFGTYASGENGYVNFGQKPFKFPPPAGFQPLALANTPRPTIVRPDQYVGIVTYTGTGATRSLTTGFKPDFLWIKERGASGGPVIVDSVRGASATLQTHATTQEQADSDAVTGFNPYGFSLGSGYTVVSVNGSTRTYVGWAWKAGGSGGGNSFWKDDIGYSTASAAGLTAGTITPTGASVNTKSGFSIIGYTGTGANATISHGLGNAPSFIIIKKRTSSPGDTNWRVYHSALGNTKAIFLSTTGTPDTNSVYWNNTSPTSSVFSLGSDDGLNASSQTHIAYLWAEIPGFSKFGSWINNNSTDGTFVQTNFKPAFIMLKNTDNVEQWFIFDNTRRKYNVQYPDATELRPNSSGAEGSYGIVATIDFLSNGFKIRGNTSSEISFGTRSYIYAAFAEAPSFNLYGGQANAR